jgi:CYTH domain-containing protein
MTDIRSAFSVETERRFLVQDESLVHVLTGLSGVSISQGYLEAAEGGSEIRVRRKGDTYSLTIKEGFDRQALSRLLDRATGDEDSENGQAVTDGMTSGLMRLEFESVITPTLFDSLWPHTAGRHIEKERFEIEHDDLTIELDRFKGNLEGLNIAEVEFPDDPRAQAFRPPAWFGLEVTHDRRYSNSALAKAGLPSVNC